MNAPADQRIAPTLAQEPPIRSRSELRRVPRLSARDVSALILLQLGMLTFGVGWIVGVVLLWLSDRWTAAEKMLGTLVVPGGAAGVSLFGYLMYFDAVDDSGCADDFMAGFCVPSWAPRVLGLPVAGVGYLALVVAALAVTAYLATVARPRRGC